MITVNNAKSKNIILVKNAVIVKIFVFDFVFKKLIGVSSSFETEFTTEKERLSFLIKYPIPL